MFYFFSASIFLGYKKANLCTVCQCVTSTPLFFVGTSKIINKSFNNYKCYLNLIINANNMESLPSK